MCTPRGWPNGRSASAATSGSTMRLLRDLEVAAILHDIGKIGTPDPILKKPAKLTDEEYAVIKKHPEYGWAVLRVVPGFERVSLFVLHHHEAFDGTGYPAGLRGDEIPIGSRIVVGDGLVRCDDLVAALSSRHAARGSHSPAGGRHRDAVRSGRDPTASSPWPAAAHRPCSMRPAQASHPRCSRHGLQEARRSGDSLHKNNPFIFQSSVIRPVSRVAADQSAMSRRSSQRYSERRLTPSSRAAAVLLPLASRSTRRI